MPNEPLQLAEFATEAIWLTEAAFNQIDKIKELAPIEDKLEKAIQKAFYKEGKLFLSELESLRGFFPKEEVKEAIIPPWYTWAMILALLVGAQEEAYLLFLGPIDAAILDSMVMGSYSVWAELAIEPTFSLAASPEAARYLQDYGASMVTKIDETTRGYIKTVVEQALEEGWSYNKTAKAITSRYQEFAIGKPQLHIQSRAHLIAITEVGNAYEQGGWEVAQYLQSQGLPMEKYWQNVGDDRVSDGCLENTAAGWIPLNDPFPSGHMRPLRFPGCRCGALYQRIGVAKAEVAEEPTTAEKITRSVTSSTKQVHDYTRDTGKEAVWLIDERGDKMFGMITGSGDKVKVSELSMADSHILVHSHPLNVSFSHGDIRTLLYDGPYRASLENMILVTPDGTVYSLSRTPTTKTWRHGDDIMLKAVEDTWLKVGQRSYEEAREQGLGLAEANTVAVEAFVQTAARQAGLDYRTSYQFMEEV